MTSFVSPCSILDMEIDPLICPYTCCNDPLPANLKPVLDAQLETSRSRISACEALISNAEEKAQECCRRMLALEEEMEGIKGEMNGHREKKEKLDEVRQKLVSTTSAIRRVPPEVIASIMWYSIWDDDGTVQNGWLIKLCCVSTLWRDTGFSTPVLWRSVNIGLGHHRSNSNPRDPDVAKAKLSRFLNQWVSRCGDGKGIEVYFSPKPFARLPINAQLQGRDIVEWIHASNFTFRSLTFQGILSSTDDVKSLFSPNSLVSSLQAMRALVMDVRAFTSSVTHLRARSSIDLDLVMPALDHLKLLPSVSRLLSMHFKHSNVTNLVLEGMTLGTWCTPHVLKNLPALQHLYLNHCVRPNVGQVQSFAVERCSTIIHRSLRVISVTDFICGEFFTEIACPSLERLELIPGAKPMALTMLDEDGGKLVGEFIHRSEPPELALYLGSPFPVHFLNPLLSSSCPHIKELDLATRDSLPVEASMDGTRLLVPRSVARIRYGECLTENQEAEAWANQLVLCLEEMSQQTRVFPREKAFA
jgi:hypothetical protein